MLLVVGSGCYLVDMLAAFLVPDFGDRIHPFIVIPSAIAQLSMVVYLLVIGVRTVKPDLRRSPSVEAPPLFPTPTALV